MSKGGAFAKAMDEAADRVFAGIDQPYRIAMQAGAELLSLGDDHSPAAGSAGVYWMEISDLWDDPRGPQSEELCNAEAAEFARAWLALANREDEGVQDEFVGSYGELLAPRLREYRARA